MFIVRILSGPLYGVDIELPAQALLFVVGTPADLGLDGATEQPAAARAEPHLSIPLAVDSPNFVLTLTDGSVATDDADEARADAPPSAAISVLAPGARPHQPVTLNQPLTVGALCFAVRHAATPWAAAVLAATAGESQPATAASPHDAQPDGIDANVSSRADADAANGKAGRRGMAAMRGALARRAAALAHCRRHWLLSGAAALSVTLLLMLLAGPLVTLWPTRAGVKPSMDSIVRALQQADATVHAGRDGRPYVIAHSAHAAAYARRALQAARLDAHAITIRTVNSERAALARVLDAQQVGYFKIDLREPAHPVIFISAPGDAPSAPSQSLRAALLAQLPYASEISLQQRPDSAAAAAATALVARTGLHYTVQTASTAPRGVTVAVDGALDDERLALLRKEIARYNAEWGTQYVQFLVRMRDDAPRRTTRTGADGYRLAGPGNLVFVGG